MDRSALLQEKPAGFGMEKHVLTNEAESKQASDTNNALRFIARSTKVMRLIVKIAIRR